MCVGSCCIRKINPDLADDMEKGCCIVCDDTLKDKQQAYQKLGYCTLECLQFENPTHELLKKCLFPGCLTFLYPIKKRPKDYCAMLCKTKHKELIKALKKLEKNKEKEKKRVELELNLKQEETRKAREERTRRFELEEYKRNLMDPDVTLLCDCEKYYIPYKNRINCKDPICLVCKTKKDKKPITQSLLRWMADRDLVHSEM